jgi:hypothetical protein
MSEMMGTVLSQLVGIGNTLEDIEAPQKNQTEKLDKLEARTATTSYATSATIIFMLVNALYSIFGIVDFLQNDLKELNNDGWDWNAANAANTKLVGMTSGCGSRIVRI